MTVSEELTGVTFPARLRLTAEPSTAGSDGNQEQAIALETINR